MRRSTGQLVAVGYVAMLRGLAVDPAQATVAEEFYSACGRQAEDTIAQQVPLRPPPFQEASQGRGQPRGWAHEDEDAAVSIRQPIRAKKVFVVGHEQETARTPVDLRVRGVPPEALFALAFTDAAEPSQAGKVADHSRLDVVVQENERRLARLLRFPPGHLERELALGVARREGVVPVAVLVTNAAVPPEDHHV